MWLCHWVNAFSLNKAACMPFRNIQQPPLFSLSPGLWYFTAVVTQVFLSCFWCCGFTAWFPCMSSVTWCNHMHFPWAQSEWSQSKVCSVRHGYSWNKKPQEAGWCYPSDAWSYSWQSLCCWGLIITLDAILSGTLWKWPCNAPLAAGGVSSSSLTSTLELSKLI